MTAPPDDALSAPAAPAAPSFGPVPLRRPDRDTVAGFREWAAARDAYQRPALPTRAEYLALPKADRRDIDLLRRVANANIDILDTAMSARVSEALEDVIWDNALNMQPGAKPGVLVSGGGAQGKTATVCEVAANFLERWEQLYTKPSDQPWEDPRRDAHEPVVYVRTPAKPTPKSLCAAVLRAVGEPHTERDTLAKLQQQVHRALVDLGARVLVLDDITRVKMHRIDDQDVLDLIRDIMDSGATLVLVGVGIRKSGLLREGGPETRSGDDVVLAAGGRLRKRNSDDSQATQTERRFRLLELNNFAYDTDADKEAWSTFLVGVASQLRLFGADNGMLLRDGLPEYLYRRSGGVVGTLVRLVSEATRAAIRDPDPETGDEIITEAVLEGVVADFAAEDGRLREAGEVPDVPPAPAATRTAARPGKARSTVFDESSANGARARGA